MTAFTDKELKAAIAEAAKAGALSRIAETLGDDYSIEVIQDEKLYLQIRIRNQYPSTELGMSSSPRYFLFRTQEPI